MSDSLDLASKLRSHFLANLPAQSYAWLNGMNGVSTPNIPPSNYPNSWLNMGERNNRHQPSLLDSVKLDKHPLGGRDANGFLSNDKIAISCHDKASFVVFKNYF